MPLNRRMGKKYLLFFWLVTLSVASSPLILFASDNGNRNTNRLDPGNSTSRIYDVDPIISLTEDTLYFESLTGSDPESSQSFTVTNTGGGTLNWKGTFGNETWLSISPSSGSLLAGLSENVTVTVSATGIPGTYEADIAITDTSAENSPQQVHIIFNEIERPAILVDVDSLFFQSFLGENPAPDSQIISFTNAGGSLMQWQASKNGDWLSILPHSGALLPGEVDTILVKVTATNSQGSYEDVISISDPNASNSPQSVIVYYDELQRPNIQVGLDTLTFESYRGADPVPNSANVVLTNTGGSLMNWTASYGGNEWLDLSKTAGNLEGGQSDTLIVTITATGSVADYEADILFEDPNALNSPQQVHIAFSEKARPLISLSKDSISFESYSGTDPSPNSSEIIVTNTGGNPLNWIASHDAGDWMELSVDQGIIGPNESDTMLVIISATDSAAHYETDIVISDPNAGNSPQQVLVKFAEMARPFILLSTDSLYFESFTGTDPAPNTASVIIANTGGNPLNWTALHNGGTWLSISSDSGVIAPGESDTLNVLISATGIAAEYQTELVIADPVAENQQGSVQIKFNEKSRPAMAINPKVLNFKSFVGEMPDPNNRIFVITNSGSDLLNWAGSANDENWLNFSPESGSLLSGESDTVMVEISPTGSASFYAANVNIEDPIASNSPQVVQITYNEGIRPAIGLDRDSLFFESVVGDMPSPASQQIVITNIGGDSLVWAGADSASWLSIFPVSGVLYSEESDTLTVVVDSTDSAGVYEGNITIMGVDAGNSPKSIPVRYNVKALPVIALSPDTLKFESYSGTDPKPGSQYLFITNPGGSTLNWTGAYPEVAWLSVSPLSGAVEPGDQDTVEVTVRATGSAGLYQAALEFMDPNAENSPQRGDVRFLEKQRPGLAVSADTLNFKSKVGETPVPDTGQFIITNDGGDTLNWTAEFDMVEWLSISHASGMVQPGGSDTVWVTVEPTGSAQNHSAVITVSDSLADGSPKSIQIGYLEDNTVAVEDLTEMIPTSFALYPNFPNPFNPETTIRFDLPEQAQIRIDLFNLRGRRVKTLVNSRVQAGAHRIVWRGDSDDGRSLSSGIYFYRMVTNKYSRYRKLMLLK